MATVSFGAILNVGTGAATIKQVSASNALVDKKNISNIINSALAIALVGGGLLATLIVFVFGLGGNLLFAKMGNPSLLLLTGVIAALLAWIEQIDNVFASAMKGSERFGRAASVEIASKTAQILSAVLAVYLWRSLIALYIALVIVAVLRLVAKASLISRLFGFSSLRPSFTNVAGMLHYAKWGWLQGVGGLLFGVADRMFVGSFLGAVSLAHYSIASQLAMQVHALTAAALSVVFPKISRKLAEDTKLSVMRIIRLTIAGNFIFSGILAIVLLFFGKKVLTLWLGPAEAAASADVLWYLTIAYWFLALNVGAHYILLGIGRVRFIALSNIFAGVVSLIVMYFLIQQRGIVGVGIARIVYGVIALVNFISLIEYCKRGQVSNAPLELKN